VLPESELFLVVLAGYSHSMVQRSRLLAVPAVQVLVLPRQALLRVLMSIESKSSVELSPSKVAKMPLLLVAAKPRMHLIPLSAVLLSLTALSP
jgi:hypothetical protein